MDSLSGNRCVSHYPGRQKACLFIAVLPSEYERYKEGENFYFPLLLQTWKHGAEGLSDVPWP